MLRILCIGAAIITWFLIPFGAYVRLKNAGLSCPDWPLCYGQFFPSGGFEIALEISHRFTALFLGILIITEPGISQLNIYYIFPIIFCMVNISLLNVYI